MHLFCPRLAEQLHYSCARRSADYRIVDKNNALPLYRLGYRVQLQLDLVFPCLLTGSYEGAGYVFALHEAHFIRDPRLL